jgi:hypothetical protein
MPTNYHTTNEGRALAGEINNTAGSLALGYIFGAHTLSLTYQQIHGDEPFDYVGFGKSDTVGDSVLLGNTSPTSTALAKNRCNCVMSWTWPATAYRA